MQLHNHPKCTR